MELWIDSEQCTGCAACINVCPKDAIEPEREELKTQPLVSVIIAVDKMVPCIEESILSICNQVYTKLEVLLICGSPDQGLRDKVSELAELDEKITLLEATDDMASAQNRALKNIRGEYVHFCTGAEVLYDCFYASLVEQLIEKKCEIINFGWIDSRDVSMCKGAYNGVGNKKAFIEAILTEPNENSDFSGYGYNLWNKIFSKDLLMVEEVPIEFSSHGYKLSNLYWLIKVALCTHKALFTSDEMLIHKVESAFVQASPTIAINDFFEQQKEAFQILEDLDEYAYEALVRTCFEYEIALLVSARSYPMPKMAEKLYQHIVYFLQIPFDEKELVDMYCQALNLKNDRELLKGKVVGLEKDRAFLKKKVENIEKDRTFLKKKLTGLEKDRAFLKRKVTGLEKNKTHLQNRIEQLEKDRKYLKTKTAKLEKELKEYKSSPFVRVAYKFHRGLAKINRGLKKLLKK